MGKRRIRCLHALGYRQIAGVDNREDRRGDVQARYDVETFESFESAVAGFKPDAIVISVPPDRHHEFMTLAVERGIPFFVEASVLDTGYAELIQRIKSEGVVAFPSSTMVFHEGIKLITSLTKTALGKISNVLVHSGQYLPDWHTYEKVSDFYVSKKETGGAREIVPFELTWITNALGFPNRVAGNYRRTVSIPGAPEIDDTYNCLLDYGTFLAVLTVDVVSRDATRRVLINGDTGQLRWDWNEDQVSVFDPVLKSWNVHRYEPGKAAEGYNANIGESMYIEEIRAFLNAMEKKDVSVERMNRDWKVLKILQAIERSNDQGVFVELR
jgi:predicted dehydrogenase